MIEGEAVAAIAQLLGQVFGWVVDPQGYGKLQLNTKLDMLRGGIREATTHDNWAAADTLFDEYRRLRQEHTA